MGVPLYCLVHLCTPSWVLSLHLISLDNGNYVAQPIFFPSNMRLTSYQQQPMSSDLIFNRMSNIILRNLKCFNGSDIYPWLRGFCIHDFLKDNCLRRKKLKTCGILSGQSVAAWCNVLLCSTNSKNMAGCTQSFTIIRFGVHWLSFRFVKGHHRIDKWTLFIHRSK